MMRGVIIHVHRSNQHALERIAGVGDQPVAVRRLIAFGMRVLRERAENYRQET